MTASILSLGLKSMICSGVLTGYYLIALKNVQINSFNRVYLLVAAIISVLLPFVHFEISDIGQHAGPDFPLLDVSTGRVDESITVTAAGNKYNWGIGLAIAYLTISIAMVLSVAAKLIWVHRLKRKGKEIRRDGYILVKTDDPRAPFSFMNMLFWPVHMREDTPEAQGMLMHELMHIRQLHTVDKIIMQLILAACWVNPFNWLIKKELWLQHEFMADRYAIKDGNSETFARMLLHSVTDSFNRSIISPFFQSPVKRRLLMLTRPAGNSYGFVRRLLSIPLLFMTVVLLAANTEHSNVASSPKKIILVLDAAHGGHDGGGTSIYGYQEKDLTLAICKKIAALSREYNIEVITTRDEDIYYTLQDRLDKSNSTSDAVFLSIHVNKSIANKEQGNNYELGINRQSKNYSNSILLASSIARKLKTQKLPVEVVDKSTVYVIRDNRHPALLIECGNLDDAENMALLRDEVRTEVLCRNILSGIVDYNVRAIK